MFHFRALASGSSGNAYLLRTERAAVLFEAGLRVPVLRQHLAAEGVSISELTAVFVSHEHTDHCLGAIDLAREHGVPIVANDEVLLACGLAGLKAAVPLTVGTPMLVGDVEVTSFSVSHDAVRPVGFCIRTMNRTIAIATDTGVPTAGLLEAVSVADLVVLEANHDREMLQSGRYPPHLRRRVAGATGHLSNTQCADILAGQVGREDVEVWLAHLSKENNTASLALSTVRRALKGLGLSPSIEVARRDRPSLRWTGALRPRQLGLFAAEAV